MENQTETEKYISNITIIFYAMFGAQAIFLIVTSFLLKSSEPMDPSLASIFQIVLPVLTIASVTGSMVIPKIILGSVSELSENEKLNKYRASSLIKWAMIEGANIFAIVVYLLTGSMFALVISLLLLMLFIYNKPSLDKMKADLNL